LIVIVCIRVKQMPKVPLAKHDNMIKAVPSDRADEPLTITILPWRSRGGRPIPDAHCPKTPETVGMFNAARLKRIKPTAYLINTARGGIVEEKALYDALVSGRLAGAGLDVFEQEPPPLGHSLFGLPNVIMAPHVAGVTREAVDRMSEQTARNILSALDGEPIRQNVINQDVLG